MDACALEKALRVITRAASVAVFGGPGLLRHPDGISSLALMRRPYPRSAKPLVMPLLDRCNQRGAWEMGAHPMFGWIQSG